MRAVRDSDLGRLPVTSLYFAEFRFQVARFRFAGGPITSFLLPVHTSLHWANSNYPVFLAKEKPCNSEIPELQGLNILYFM
jgi:hypothetical protein